MDLDDKVFYNQGSAAKLGWDPSWFGTEEFDEVLIDKIKEFQREYELSSDGLCGPITYRRARTAREAAFETRMEDPGGAKGIIANGEVIPIDWDKVVNVLSERALALPSNCYKAVTRDVRVPTMVVTHWDVCLSARSCFRVLKKKGISSHFAIDNDGTIYQMVDTQHIGWHAGNRRVNNASVGIDFSNAYYTKYQSYYERGGFGSRPLLEDSVVHGRTLAPHLGYYPVQIGAYKALLKCLHDHYKIKLECPLDDEGDLLTEVCPKAAKGRFKGIINHYHLTRKKKDCAGLELNKILQEITSHSD